MNKKIVSALIILGLLIFSLAHSAQTGTAVVFKYNPGEMLHYKISGVGNGTIRLLSKDSTLNTLGFNSTYPVNLSFETFLTASTLSVSTEGIGTWSMKVNKMDINCGIMNQQFRFVFGDKKLQVYTNGQLSKDESMDSVNQNGFMGKPFIFTMTNRGQLLDIQIPGMDQLNDSLPYKTFIWESWKNQMSPFLPDKLFVTGDHWKSTTRIDFPPGISFPKPFQVIRSFTVDGFKDMDGENCMILKTQCNNDFTGLSFSPDTVSFPSLNGMGKMEAKFKQGNLNSNGEIVIGVNSGKLKKCSGDINLGMELYMQIPLAGKKALEFTVGVNGKMNSVMELSPESY